MWQKLRNISGHASIVGSTWWIVWPTKYAVWPTHCVIANTMHYGWNKPSECHSKIFHPIKVSVLAKLESSIISLVVIAIEEWNTFS